MTRVAGSGVTDSSGLFEVTNIGVDLGAESAAALDFEQSGALVYLILTKL